MGRAFKVGTAPEISSEDIKEDRDIKYTDRVDKELFMDIFEPETVAANDLNPQKAVVLFRLVLPSNNSELVSKQGLIRLCSEY